MAAGREERQLPKLLRFINALHTGAEGNAGAAGGEPVPT